MPVPPYSSDQPIAWENYIAVQIMQSMLGLISRRVDAVAFEIDGEHVRLYFAIPGATPGDYEDVEDICDDFSIFLEDKVTIESIVHEGPRDDSWRARQLREVYAAKSAQE